MEQLFAEKLSAKTFKLLPECITSRQGIGLDRVVRRNIKPRPGSNEVNTANLVIDKIVHHSFSSLRPLSCQEMPRFVALTLSADNTLCPDGIRLRQGEVAAGPIDKQADLGIPVSPAGPEQIMQRHHPIVDNGNRPAAAENLLEGLRKKCAEILAPQVLGKGPLLFCHQRCPGRQPTKQILPGSLYRAGESPAQHDISTAPKHLPVVRKLLTHPLGNLCDHRIAIRGVFCRGSGKGTGPGELFELTA